VLGASRQGMRHWVVLAATNVCRSTFVVVIFGLRRAMRAHAGPRSRAIVRRVLERANDTAACFALREVKNVLADRRLSPSTAIARIGSIVNEFSRSAQQSNKLFWWKKPSAR
jgi:hypothetical protein